MYTVYAIYNKKHKKLYIGQTVNFESRLELHNQGVFEGYTSRFDDMWTLIYSEDVQDRKTALKREKQLKSFQGRRFVKTFIPTFRRPADQR